MIRQIAGTAVSRGVIAIIGLIVLTLNTRYLGAEKLGLLSIYLIAIHFVLQISELIGGSALVFAQKTTSVRHLMLISYAWSLSVILVATPILFAFLEASPVELLLIAAATLIQSFNHCHLHLLVGKEKIERYNVSALVQATSMVSLLMIFYLTKSSAEIIDFLYAYTLAQTALFVASRLFLRSLLKKSEEKISWEKELKRLLSFGFLVQLANIFQFGVYRVNYLILKSFTSLPTLGIFTLGNQLSEKALIPGNAVSTVQYSKISNQDDLQESTKLTFQLMPVNVILTIISVTALICIPSSVITWLFSEEFVQAQGLFVYFSPGIIFMSVSLIYSHFFAGLGKYQLNAATSFMGLVAVIIISVILIPIWGMKGAAVASSSVFFLQATAQLFLFKRVSKLSWAGVFTGHWQGFKSVSFTKLVKGLR